MPHRLRARYPPTNATAVDAAGSAVVTSATVSATPDKVSATSDKTAATPKSLRSSMSYRERFRSWNSTRTDSADVDDDELLVSCSSSSSSSSSGASSFASRLFSSVSTPSSTDRSRPMIRRKVRVSDRELVRRAATSDAARSLQQALDRPLTAWDSARHTKGFTTLSGGDQDTDDSHEVLVVGEVACAPQEIATLLRASDESHLNSSMRAVHGNRFIYGSVVHIVDPQQLLKQGGAVSDGDQVAVKTSCFARSRMLAKNEEWCYLEHFQRDPRAASDFTVVQLSMREKELAAGKTAPNRRVEQLGGVTTVYRIEELSKPAGTLTKASQTVRVTFHAQYSKSDVASDGSISSATIHEDREHNDDNGDDEAAYASGKTAKLRLQALAESVRTLPTVVRKRRLGRQVFADTNGMGEATNSKCISCTRSLHLLALTVKKRCQLCSYNVCAGCCSSEKVETYNGHSATMMICRRCLECVDRCDYSHIQIGRTDSEYIMDEDDLNAPLPTVDEEKQQQSIDIDDPVLSGPSIIMNRGDGDSKLSPPVRSRRSTGAAIVETLRTELQSDETKDAAMNVIHHLLATSSELAGADSSEEDEEDTVEEKLAAPVSDVGVEKKNADSSMTSGSVSVRSSSTSSCISSESEGWQHHGSPEECVSAVEAYFRRRDHELALGACELANATQRNYPIDIDAEGEKPVAPIPANEEERMRVIDQLQLMELQAPMQELDIICDFLNLEIGLSVTMITIVGAEYQLVLACTMKGLVMANLPREHTFCQHLMMDDKPFVINNPEADVRFYNMNPITQNGVKFYCGIPITSDDGLVVGSICCLHMQPMQLTRSQFGTLTKFGRIASRIIMTQAKRQVTASIEWPLEQKEEQLADRPISVTSQKPAHTPQEAPAASA